MISGSSAIGSDYFLNGIANLQSQELKTQRQISSGFRIQDAADSPAQTPELIDLGSNLAAYQAYQQNLGRVQAETNAADSALGSSITLVEQARGLAVRGATATSSPEERQNLALQIKGIQQQIVGAANTTVEGRFIFGGGSDNAPPYQIDAASATGVDALTNPAGGRIFTDPLGQIVFQAGTASAIFDPRDVGGAPSAGNTFAALQSLVLALQANDTNGINTSLTSLQNASGWLNRQQASYGTAEARIGAELDSAATQITALKTRISALRDTDIAAAASDLARETTAQSAAFAAQAQVPRKSLFDYLG